MIMKKLYLRALICTHSFICNFGFRGSQSLLQSASSIHRDRGINISESNAQEYSQDAAKVSFRTNSTHVSWPIVEANEKDTAGSTSAENYEIQERNHAERECLQFLQQHMMPIDVPNAESLGFPSKNAAQLPDGLSFGIVGPSIKLSLEAKRDYHAWTKDVPREIYYEYVANFANVNEPRTNWRPIFYKALAPIVQQFVQDHNVKVEAVVDAVNDHVWSAFNHLVMLDKGEIRFEAGQTPLIYDPMSVLLFGYASCTGISIFLINALRAVGIPARLAGTDAWNGVVENGNHSWIEVWIKHKWYILEAKPAAGGLVKDWMNNPCKFWFCNPSKAANTTFYAARLSTTQLDSETSNQELSRRLTDQIHFPLAWDRDNQGIPGENRTIYMIEICTQCIQ